MERHQDLHPSYQAETWPECRGYRVVTRALVRLPGGWGWDVNITRRGAGCRGVHPPPAHWATGHPQRGLVSAELTAVFYGPLYSRNPNHYPLPGLGC